MKVNDVMRRNFITVRCVTALLASERPRSQASSRNQTFFHPTRVSMGTAEPCVS